MEAKQQTEANRRKKKPEIMLVGLSTRISLVGCESADIRGNSISSVKYLGVHLDQTLPMKQYINSLCCTAFLAIRKIASIRSFLSDNSTAKLVSSMITKIGLL